MDKTERGALLVEQEELERLVKKLVADLRKIGNAYESLGKSLTQTPHQVGFANVPIAGLGSNPMHVRSIFGWNDIPDKQQIAEKLQELHAASHKLDSVRIRLE